MMLLPLVFQNLIPQENSWHQVNVWLTVGLLVLLAALYYSAPPAWNPVFRAIGRPFSALVASIQRRPLYGYALVFLASGCVSGLLALFAGLPVPGSHDEFGYLLAADTFAHGRMTNPTHPHWPFFDTFHVLMQPSYMAKFSPGSSLVMALGQVWAGSPIMGVWLCHAVACAAIYGTLRAVLPVGWSLLGGIFVALNPQLLEWSQSYWGGSLPTLGGALVLGASLHLARYREPLRPPTHAILLGIGIVILVNSRPYEGVVFSFLCILAAVSYRLQRKALTLPLVLRVGLWTSIPIIPAVCLMMLYNRAVTGSPFRMPYAEYQAQADPVPLFFWGKPRPLRQDLDPTIQKFYAANLESFHHQAQRPADKLIRFTYRQGQFWKVLAYVPIFLVGLVATIAILLRKRSNTLLRGVVVLSLCFVASHLSFYTWTHYTSPYLCLYLLLALIGLRWLSTRQRPGRARSLQLLPRVVVPLLIVFSGTAYSLGYINRDIDTLPKKWAYERVGIQQYLTQLGGKHLIFVRYGPNHSVHNEWVYNKSDLDNSPVVWARDKGDEQNQVLIDYYRDRTVYRITMED